MSMPYWLDLIPAVSAVITLVGLSLKAGRILQKLDGVLEDVKDIQAEMKEMDRRITALEAKIG